MMSQDPAILVMQKDIAQDLAGKIEVLNFE